MPQTPTHMCTHHQESWASLEVRKADECGQPGRCMMHSRLTLPGNFFSHGLLRIPPRPRQTPINLSPLPPPKCHNNKCPMPTEASGAQPPWRHYPVRPWRSLAIPRCPSSSWPLLEARPESRVQNTCRLRCCASLNDTPSALGTLSSSRPIQPCNA